MNLPAEEDTAPRKLADTPEDGALSDAQKASILQEVDEQKRAQKKQAAEILREKKKAALGITIPSAARGGAGSSSSSSTSAAGASSSNSGGVNGTAPASATPPAGSAVKAAKALSPEKKGTPRGGAAAAASLLGGKAKEEKSAAAAGGSGAKAALAIKTGGGAGGAKGKGKASGSSAASGSSTKKKGGGSKKGGSMLAAAKEVAGSSSADADADADAGAPEAAAAPAAAPTETAEERAERIVREEKEREEERERLYKEREEQRREIEQAIWAEERRLREKERKKREEAAKLRKRQATFREACFDGEVDLVKTMLQEMVEEAFGATLIGAKIDCADEHKTTPLSEAACAGQVEICKLLLDHGAAINGQNDQARTPLWRAAFMDKRETCQLLLEHGADPRLKADTSDFPEMVAPSKELKELLGEWPCEQTDALIAAREKLLANQWLPPPPDPEDQPAGEAGYFLQIALTRFSDALDSVTQDSDRPVVCLDLGGKVTTYFEYRDCNMHCYARSPELEKERVRKGLLGALRYGKPFVLDMMHLPLEEETIRPIFDDIQAGLFDKVLSKKIYREEHYLSLVVEEDGEEYKKAYWNDATTAHFAFVILSRQPQAPQWVTESFFVIRVSS